MQNKQLIKLQYTFDNLIDPSPDRSKAWFS